MEEKRITRECLNPCLFGQITSKGLGRLRLFYFEFY